MSMCAEAQYMAQEANLLLPQNINNTLLTPHCRLWPGGNAGVEHIEGCVQLKQYP